ncbi:MGMT family protein [Kineococcus rhizosphaerae]|uniref:Alkylated DNA nucleotide flippase Atl1 n=1 Tax=Kineococcus rhizosphaerae TaxID=559628 RepID=A0A2T0R452_9ACTN|nr:MGMT family protein [Kineococcus rhizosphaerae]PRY15133.1 alkylated DNA nucleotide flippase Atl1 [Kineococcus rhizosphaerae]
MDPHLPERAEEILEVVHAIPRGRVLTYGDVGARVGDRGPRFVGNVLRRFGSDVPWWRVLRADGSAPPPLADEALRRWRAEGTPLRRLAHDAADVRVDLGAARWDAGEWTAPWEPGVPVAGEAR